MIAIYRESGVVYLAQTEADTKAGSHSSSTILNPENWLIWKIKGTPHALGASTREIRDADLLRYQTLFRGSLNLTKLHTVIGPRIHQLLDDYKRLDSDGDARSSFVFAKDDQAAFIRYNGEIRMLNDLDASENLDFIKGFFALHPELPAEERLIKALQCCMIEKGFLPGPIFIMNTRSTIPQCIRDKS